MFVRLRASVCVNKHVRVRMYSCECDVAVLHGCEIPNEL